MSNGTRNLRSGAFSEKPPQRGGEVYLGPLVRRAILLLAAMALMVAAYSGAALAAFVTCSHDGSLSPQPRCEGTTGDDILLGSDFDDRIVGKLGSDWIQGGAGNDDLNGGDHDDTYSFRDNYGLDVIHDVSGQDTLNFSRVTPQAGGVDIVLPPGLRSTGVINNEGMKTVRFGGFGEIVIIERAVGSKGSDTIQGGKEKNTLMPGPGGEDQLTDQGGDDTYKGFRSGSATITDGGGITDVIDLRPLTSDEVSFDREAGTTNLHIETADGYRIVVVNHVSDQGRIENLVLADRSYYMR